MKILLFDGFSILNRAFYALPPLTNSAGEYTNAVYGFLSIFFRFLDEERPDYVTVAWDLPKPTFRHEMYGAYKGTRKGMPDELRVQVPTIKALLEKMQVTMAACEGYEADDVLGTLAKKAVAQGVTPVIVTGDRDMLQLASEEIKIRVPKTKAGKTEVEDYNAAEVMARYGVSPEAFVDVKALMGDASDNIPGVPGIGEKTATKIIAEYGTLENAIANAAEIKPKKASENLAEFSEQAILSRALAAIATDAPVELELTSAENLVNKEALAEVKRLELKRLYKRFDVLGQTSPGSIDTGAAAYKIIKTRDKTEEIFAELLRTKDGAAFFPLWHGNACEEGGFIVGFAVANANAAYYFPLGGGELTLFSHEEDLIAPAKPWLVSDAPKYVYDAKSVLRQVGDVKNIVFDAMLAAYVLDPLRQTHSAADIADTYLQEEIPTLESLLDNKGKRTKERKTVANLPESTAASYAVSAASAIYRARPLMEEKLDANNQSSLFRDMELPLAYLLAEIETIGIKVCKPTLENFGVEMDKKIAALTTLIHDFAGEDFNINSPAQLGEILFTKLGLKGGKKTQKGYSTAADVLENLKDKHAIIPLILEYRAVSKLKSTYVDGMIPLIREGTSRIHSTFHQALTATGRLSSAEPNLQNIPVRTALGRELRKAFVPAEGCVFLDADYSQIELRLLAHISDDPVLINAFKENQDIHRLTASQVLHVAPEDVTPEQRNNAKAVNFGIIYGISAFGLSEDLKIPVKEAEGYIKGYFEKYPGVKKYLDETIAAAKKDGYVSTLYNRRRALPELKSSNFNTRSFGERVAMNMPIQGTAADIIKIAMLNVAARLKRENFRTQIVLQVHDELLLESPKEEAERVAIILKEEMENAAQLSIPLAAEVNVGESWYATK
ncbi:MAG: DNA polymerase I [Defluviitaleaceae bacterium]|nr:DNA polymerase I [Defluviitaleaceae bacterium]